MKVDQEKGDEACNEILEKYKGILNPLEFTLEINTIHNGCVTILIDDLKENNTMH